ncbi:YbhB/YbcL family Raf kinase inhibitor-like protein [Thalassotalea atypica]|uniref:YbhB/YbcL family Raf kinase inhibitor-like protein n=1 Tax=Thalassotalea atypica TaxID=2054316 RepID=UPI0025724D00|nr:YbhB/YbcL family Raf kinase inhibitor-like protein [Thalassotalea atypica]
MAPVIAGSLTLTSNDIKHGKHMSTTQEFQGFGCSGENLSPQLEWSGAPTGTKSFAITVYDPDAPTGSGWWHWQVINIPKGVNELAAGAGSSSGLKLPAGAAQVQNDYGIEEFGGACPPQGHGVHRYQFTLHALKVAKIELPKGASSALAGYMINANAIETATIEALYQRGE